MAILPTTAMPTLRKRRLLRLPTAPTTSPNWPMKLQSIQPTLASLCTHISSPPKVHSNPTLTYKSAEMPPTKCSKRTIKTATKMAWLVLLTLTAMMKSKWTALCYLTRPLMATQPNLHGQATLLLLPKYIQKAILKLMSANKRAKRKIPNLHTANQLWMTKLLKIIKN